MTTIALVTVAFTVAAGIRLAHGERQRHMTRRIPRHAKRSRLTTWLGEGSRD